MAPRFTLLAMLLFIYGIASAQKKFRTGYYYSHDGQKYEGLLRLVSAADYGNGPDNHIMFKEAESNTPYKITTRDAKGFVIDKDSFTIIKNFQINDLASYAEDFVRVAATGKINLYQHFSTGGYGSTFHYVSNYLAEKDGKLQRLKKKDFKDDYPALFAEYPELIGKIKKKELSYDDIEEIVRLYNMWFMK